MASADEWVGELAQEDLHGPCAFLTRQLVRSVGVEAPAGLFGGEARSDVGFEIVHHVVDAPVVPGAR